MNETPKYLKNLTAYSRWAHRTFVRHRSDKAQLIKQHAPKEFPCFAVLVVDEWGYEDEKPVYFYKDHARQLLR